MSNLYDELNQQTVEAESTLVQKELIRIRGQLRAQAALGSRAAEIAAFHVRGNKRLGTARTEALTRPITYSGPIEEICEALHNDGIKITVAHEVRCSYPVTVVKASW